MTAGERGLEGRMEQGRESTAPASGPAIKLATYTVIPLWYGCNNDCVICMLGPVKGKLRTVDRDLFKRLVIGIAGGDTCRRLILSGAEVTTFDDLEDYVRFAAGMGWFETIQIQTNGRKLADPAYLRRLIEAGVNEFFISLHGPKDVHDAISRVPGSYEETMEGIHNLADYPVKVLTNTVLTRLNYPHLPGFFSAIAAGGVSEMHLWNFFPMDERDEKDLVVPVTGLMRLIDKVAPLLASSRKPLVLKAFPECLPVHDPVFIDNDFPAVLIPDAFWGCLEKSGFGSCVYRESCMAKTCWGLSRPYIAKFGDERSILTPVAR